MLEAKLEISQMLKQPGKLALIIRLQLRMLLQQPWLPHSVKPDASSLSFSAAETGQSNRRTLVYGHFPPRGSSRYVIAVADLAPQQC